MFVKTTKSKNYEYIKLVESYWEDGTTKHRVLYNFGRRDLIKNDQMFINMVKKLCEIAEIPTFEERKAALYDCSEATMLNFGYIAYAKLWEELGIANCMRSIQDKSKIQFPFSETTFLMAVQHLLCPGSKLSTYEHQDSYFGLKEAELQHLYRALDKLCDEKEYVESQLFEQNYRISGQKVDEVRPVFHWTPKRIHGHFVICFLSFLMERRLEMLLSDEKDKDVEISPERIREALNSMQLASVTLNNEEVYIKTKNQPLGSKIFKKLKLKTSQKY